MADRGKPLDFATEQRIKRLAQVQSIRQTAKTADVSRNTVRKILRNNEGR